MSIVDLMITNSRTPAECHVYRKRDAQILALQRSAMCNKSIYRPYRTKVCDLGVVLDRPLPKR